MPGDAVVVLGRGAFSALTADPRGVAIPFDDRVVIHEILRGRVDRVHLSTGRGEAMHARVATFEGGDPDEVRKTISELRQRAESGPPEGVPAVGFLVLHKPDKVLAIGLFDTEQDLKQGDATLNSMDPPVPGAMGQRTSVEMYEVGIKVDS